MTAWQSPTIFVTGDVLDVNSANVWSNNELFLYQSPYAAIYGSTGTALTQSSTTQVTLGGTTALGYNFSVSSNNLVVPLTGIYSVSGAVNYTAGSGSSTQWFVSTAYHNGGGVLQGGVSSTATLEAASSFSGIVSASASDTLGLWAYTTQAGVTTNTGANLTYLHAFFVGSQ